MSEPSKPTGPDLAQGIPLDPNTLDQLRGAARSVGLLETEIERAIIPTETTRASSWSSSKIFSKLRTPAA